MLSYEELGGLADNLLKSDLTSKKKNKSRLCEYPILSDSQLKRRRSMEIPYSNLSERQRIDCRSKGMDYTPKEGE